MPSATAVIPDLQGDPVSEAAQALAAVGLRLGAVGSTVDNLCEFIDKVIRQNPGAGTVVPVASSVSVTIGAPPPHACP